jgi:hypothetical protein
MLGADEVEGGIAAEAAIAAVAATADEAVDTVAAHFFSVGALHCIFGNPFRPLQPRSFSAHVPGLAASIYAAFPAASRDSYAILADALEDMVEDDAATHCRQERHAKGCHVIDWILGRS